MDRTWEPRRIRSIGGRLRPIQKVVAGYLIAAAIGTLLLMLPVSTTAPSGSGFFTAVFTAVAAVCLTGLVIVDTSAYWSTFGQVVILCLIQIGGFGIMAFASIIGLGIVRRATLRSKLTTAAEVRSLDLADIRATVLGIVKVALTVEAVAALILTLRFAISYGYPWRTATWYGIFHAVSAFNNAGFALFTDSMVGFVGDAVICLTLAAAIVIGGLGFPVILQLRKYRTEPLHWSMNTRIVLWGTVVLLVGGIVFITAAEWNNPDTLGALPLRDRLLAGVFQAVQTRTAGFHSVDITQMHSVTWLGMDALVFIGGGPAGTAGGIKITTFAVLFFIMAAEIRGDAAVNVFGKRLSRAVHRQAITVALLAVAIVVSSTAILMILADLSLDVALFEIVCAFGTAGFSTGVTASLPLTGKVLVLALMLVGRIGPFAVASALALRQRRLLYELPKERPIIG